MAIKHHIRNPLEWGVDQFAATGDPQHAPVAAEAGYDAIPEIRRIEVADLWDALVKGFEDFGARRTDIMFLCLIYPVIGLILARAASGDMVPLVFPLLSGFALVGPVAGLGLYEISRRREAGLDVSWFDVFRVAQSPRFGAIAVLAVALFAVFAVWLGAAYAIYAATLGPEPPTSIGGFLLDVTTTGAGWTMIVVGMGVGFVFAVLALAVGVVSFPLLLDRNVGLLDAVTTSVRAVIENPGPMAAWGLIVAGGLVIGALPALIGLIIVLPTLGHATWHLYRKVVPR
jgi:uncharacterized membrane protein